MVDGLRTRRGPKKVTSNTLGMRIGGHLDVLGALFRHLMIIRTAKETGTTGRLNGSNELIKVVRTGGGFREEILDCTDRVVLMAKVLGGFSHVTFAAVLTGLQTDSSEKVGHLEAVWKMMIVGT